jgi:hypothetical protein
VMCAVGVVFYSELRCGMGSGVVFGSGVDGGGDYVLAW